MSHKLLDRVFSYLLLLGLVGTTVLPVAAAPQELTQKYKETAPSPAPDNLVEPSSTFTPIILGPFSPLDTTGMGPVSSSMSTPNKAETVDIQHDLLLPKAFTTNAGILDPAIDRGETTLNMPAPIVNFEGVNNLDNVYPPDTDGDVGPNHYIQMVNFHLAIYDKAGQLLYGPFKPNLLWPALDPCGTNSDGDVVTLYDQLADRWILSQFRFPNYPRGPYYECIAVSKTPDPTNIPSNWWLYSLPVSQTKMNDYPKLAVWPDAYYMTANQFSNNASQWSGAGVWALERAKMLLGQTIHIVYFDLYSVNPNFGGMLPVDWDGYTQPPQGSPGYFVEVDDSSWIGPTDAVRIWKFHVDWTTPGSSTFGLGGQPNAILQVANFNPLPCTIEGSRSCIPQPDTNVKVDGIGDRLMFRAVYRNFGDHEAILFNHTVLGNGSDVAGIRWYELRNPGGAPTIYQQGTFAPNDGLYRWMGSLAFDHMGNIALGYSLSSGSVYPSIRYAGRLASDPLGTMSQGEVTIINGSGSQTATGSRWGDYSAMSVDPVDDCTFYYTQEYIQTTGPANWQTRVASFKFPNCTIGETGTLSGTVVDAITQVGISGATVRAVLSQGESFSTATQTDGTYQITLPVGTYMVTASAYGYISSTEMSITVNPNQTTTQNFALEPAPLVTIQGAVTDAATHWPLYARITIDGYPGAPIWTDPVTGQYSIDLASGGEYTFHVEAFASGYLSYSETVQVNSSLTKNFALQADQAGCIAPGYYATGIDEPFNNTTIPPGWRVVNNGGTCNWRFDNPSQLENLTGGSGNFAVADSDYCGAGTTMNTTLYSPIVDVSSQANVNLSFAYDYNNFSLNEIAAADISADGGATWAPLVSWNNDKRGPATFSQDVTSIVSGTNQAQLRFRYVAPGFEWWWEVDDVVMGAKTCLTRAGGLVVGNVYDANTLAPVVGAKVTNDGGGTVTTVANPDDMEHAPAFYTMFSPTGMHPFTATYYHYGEDAEQVNVVGNNTVQQDFHLPAGLLAPSPSKLEASLALGSSITLPLTLANEGGIPVDWEFKELDKGVVLSGPFEYPEYVIKPFKQGFPTGAGLDSTPAPDAPPYAAGDVIQIWPAGIVAWGLAYDALDETVWLSSPGISWNGDDHLYEYTLSGVPTGRSYLQNWPHTVGPADMAYNQHTGMLWSMNVDLGVNNCIYEISPDSGYTGNSICPGGGTGIATTQRGLAYDPSTDTYFVGSWNDHMVYRFSADGTILAQVNTGMDVAGLAYNPDTQHLFVMTNTAPNLVFVLDVANNYSILGQFGMTDFSNYGGAGFEMDCTGHLWALDQITQIVYEIDSGETTSMCNIDVPWLSETPTSGSLGAGLNQPVSVAFDAGVPEASQPGVYKAQLKIKHDTPYFVANIPVTMTIEIPATYGKLAGTVTGLGYCDADPAPLANAKIDIEGTAGYTSTLTTDDNGHFQLWLDQSHSPLTLAVTAGGYQTSLISGVVIVGGQTNTQNFDLRWLEPCVSTDPISYEMTVTQGYSLTVPLQLINNGASSTVFEINEVPGTISETPPTPVVTQPRQVILSLESIPGSGIMTNVPAAPEGAVPLVLDDGTHESSIGFTDFSYSYQFLWLNRFTPSAGDFPFNLNQIQIFFPIGEATVGGPLDMMVYQDADGNPANGATLLATYHFIVQYADGNKWSIYNLPDPLIVTGPGDVLIAAVNRWVASGKTPPQYPAALDTNSSNQRSWVGLWTGDPPDPAILPPNDTMATIDSQGFPGNWLIRGYGVTGGADVPWLSENPLAGVMDTDSTSNVAVTFDSLDFAVGTYHASLALSTDDPEHPTLYIPVTMHIVAPASPVASFSTNSPVDIGEPVIFTNNSYLGAPESTDFEWDFGDGITQTVHTVDPQSHTYSESRAFHATLTVCNVIGCSTAYATILVSPKQLYLPFISKR